MIFFDRYSSAWPAERVSKVPRKLCGRGRSGKLCKHYIRTNMKINTFFSLLKAKFVAEICCKSTKLYFNREKGGLGLYINHIRINVIYVHTYSIYQVKPAFFFYSWKNVSNFAYLQTGLLIGNVYG